VGGFNAYPAEIENLLLRHPRIAQAAVVGVPDERLGEVGTAFVVATPGPPLAPGDVVEWAKGEMANFKVPRVVEVVAALPVNATGKVVKDALRTRAAALAAARGEQPSARGDQRGDRPGEQAAGQPAGQPAEQPAERRS
jgi:acyl-CoA synthetase (AMP-forming)/AMP-acid ligase II